eukprot:4262963-Pyramimonas_sp.AAC.1
MPVRKRHRTEPCLKPHTRNGTPPGRAPASHKDVTAREPGRTVPTDHKDLESDKGTPARARCEPNAQNGKRLWHEARSAPVGRLTGVSRRPEQGGLEGANPCVTQPL